MGWNARQHRSATRRFTPALRLEDDPIVDRIKQAGLILERSGTIGHGRVDGHLDRIAAAIEPGAGGGNDQSSIAAGARIGPQQSPIGCEDKGYPGRIKIRRALEQRDGLEIPTTAWLLRIMAIDRQNYARRLIGIFAGLEAAEGTVGETENLERLRDRIQAPHLAVG